MISIDRTSQLKGTRPQRGRWSIALNLVLTVTLQSPLESAGEEPGTAPGDNKPKVGAYYYPWYDASNRASRHTWRHAMRLHLDPPQSPKAGLYDSRDPAVIGEHIAQSLRGGIDFWAVSWWGPHRYDDRTFRKHILTHPDADKLRYAILYESTGRLGSFDQPHYRNWIRDLTYLRERYFDHPNYLRINDRPVLFVYLTREYFRDRGDEALAEMRTQFPEIYLVADDVFLGDPAVDSYQPEWAKGFDAVTAYDIYGQSIGPLGNTQKAIDFLAANYRQARAAANSVGVAFIPGIAPGYNDTAVRKGHPGRARYFTDRETSDEGDVFRAMIQDVALPNLDPRSDHIFMVTSFNEWYEDSQIEATTGTAPPSRTDDSDSGDDYTGGQTYHDYGHLYLDILKKHVEKKTGSRQPHVVDPGSKPFNKSSPFPH